jgi:hypothetical protein
MKLVSEYCKIIRQGARADYRDPVMIAFSRN